MSIPHSARLGRASVLGLVLAWSAAARPAAAQELLDDMVGQNEKAWTTWKAALKLVEREKTEEAKPGLEMVAGMRLSPLRLALMADRTGSLRLEQLAQASDAAEWLKQLVDQIKQGRRQRALAEEGWHYAAIGRFKYADASFKALDQSNPDSVALLELARYNPNRHLVLVKLVSNAEVGPSAKRMIEILQDGEQRLRMDPYEIAANVAKLAGTPRQVDHATQALRDSGEYAVPHLIQFLQNDKYRNLRPQIIQVLPKIGRGALNPLCISLGMKNDDVTVQDLIEALGKLGYRQAAPYLAKLAAAESQTSAEVRNAATQVLSRLGDSPSRPVTEAFLELAEGYWRNEESLRADTRVDAANVWYLVENELRYIPVPTPIFADVMAMRCCEEALAAAPDTGEAVALWLASNFRREARLGLNVESDQPDPMTAKDATRPDGYPRSIYFARAAGPHYCHKVLGRAVADADPGVALGAVAALAATAGEPSLVGSHDARQALVQALSFPNRQVRIKTAIALARALPQSPFSQCENVIPVLAEALSQSGKMATLVADPNDETRNKLVTALRAAGFECAAGPSLHQAGAAGREANLTTFDAAVLATDVADPDLAGAIADLRRNFQTASAPILVIRKPEQSIIAQRAREANPGVEVVPVEVLELGDPAKITERLTQSFSRGNQMLGMAPLSGELALGLAIQAADVLRLVAETGNKVYDVSRATPALILALQHSSEELRIRSAHALALSTAPEAQEAIAAAAMKTDYTLAMRVAAFGSLAESARRNGRLLGEESITRIIELVKTEKDLILQGAASKALGALDLPSNLASEIIRSQSRG